MDVLRSCFVSARKLVYRRVLCGKTHYLDKNTCPAKYLIFFRQTRCTKCFKTFLFERCFHCLYRTNNFRHNVQTGRVVQPPPPPPVLLYTGESSQGVEQYRWANLHTRQMYGIRLLFHKAYIFVHLHGIMRSQTDYFTFNNSVQTFYEQIFSLGTCFQIFD